MLLYAAELLEISDFLLDEPKDIYITNIKC